MSDKHSTTAAEGDESARVERVLAAGRWSERPGAADDAALRADLLRLRSALATAEEATRGEHSLLVGRILGRTTREDPSRRGDLVLVGRFLRERLRSSVLLRVAAASLLAHIVAVPVLGYFALRAGSARDGFSLRIEPRSEPFAERPLEPERPLRLLEIDEELPPPAPGD